MNKVKINTIKKVIINLELIIKNLQAIIDILERVWAIKNESAVSYQNTTNSLEKNSHLIHTIWKIKDLASGTEDIGFCQKLRLHIDNIKAIFANSNDYHEIVNADTINNFRFVNFPNATNDNFIELNVVPIKSFLDTITHSILFDLLKRIDLFIKVEIDKLVIELEIDEPDETVPLANILKFEEIWDFRFDSYLDTAKNFALIQQTKYQMIINKLQDYLIHLSQGDEFLLSKTCRLVMLNMFEQQNELLANQEVPLEIFYKIRDEFMKTLQILFDSNAMQLETINSEVITITANRVINTEHCLINYNKQAFNEQFYNILYNVVTNDQDNSFTNIANDMKLKLALTNNYLIATSNAILEKLNFTKHKNDMFESKTFGYFLHDLANNFAILEMKKILAEIKFHSHNLIITKLYDFNNLKQKYFLQSKKSELQIIENNVDVNLLANERPVRPKVKVFTVTHNYTLEEEIFANKWKQIKDSKINEILTMNEKQTLTTIIDEEILELETMLQEVAVNKSETISTCQQIFFNKLKNVFLHLEMITNTAIVRYFPKYLAIPDNQYAKIFVDKAIEYIVLKQSTITIWQHHLLELENIFDQNSQYKNKNIIFIEHSNFKEAALLINQQSKNYNLFKQLLMNTTALVPLPELKINPQPKEIIRFQNNHDILTFAPTTQNLLHNEPRKLLIEFKSLKTKLIIKQWEIIYPQLLINFYGNHNDIFTELKTLLATMRFIKTRMSKLDTNTLPKYLQDNFSKLLTDITAEINKLKSNIGQYLDDHSTKVKILYIDCYDEQEALRIKIYDDVKKYLVDANILSPTSAGMIDITLNNFHLLLANKQDSEFNRFFGYNWHEQVNTLLERLSLHINTLITTYEQIFTSNGYYSKDDEKLLKIFKINAADWFTISSTPNFCFIPPVVNDSKSLSLTAPEIKTLCPLTLPSINLTNEGIQKQQIMPQDWATISELLQTRSSSDTYQTTTLWIPRAQPQTFLTRNATFAAHNTIFNSTNIIMIISSIFIIAIPICIFYLLIKKCNAKEHNTGNFLVSKPFTTKKRAPAFNLLSATIINNETITNFERERTVLLPTNINENGTNNPNLLVTNANTAHFQNEMQTLITVKETQNSLPQLKQQSSKPLGY